MKKKWTLHGIDPDIIGIVHAVADEFRLRINEAASICIRNGAQVACEKLRAEAARKADLGKVYSFSMKLGNLAEFPKKAPRRRSACSSQ